MTDPKIAHRRGKQIRRSIAILSERLDLLRERMSHLIPLPEDDETAKQMVEGIVETARREGLVDELFEAIALLELLAANPVFAPTQLVTFARPFGLNVFIERFSPEVVGHC